MFDHHVADELSVASYLMLPFTIHHTLSKGYVSSVILENNPTIVPCRTFVSFNQQAVMFGSIAVIFPPLTFIV
jgi:hypothetical protein